MFEPVKPRRVYQVVVEQIQAMVLDGRLRNGDRLPTERELSVQLQVSRASVREGMRALEILGIVESRQGEGTFINARDELVFQPLSMLYALREGGVREVLEFRMMIESEAAALAALRLDASSDERLAAALAALERARGEAARTRADQDLHRCIAECSGNRLLVAMSDAVSALLRDCIARARQVVATLKEPVADLRERHRRLVAAIRARDPQAAREAVRAHFDQIVDKLG